MNDPLKHLKSVSAPQRPGFREQLEQRVQTAIQAQPTPMTSRLTFLKYLLAAPLLATAVYGAAFFIGQQSTGQPTRWTAQAVQAAVIKSIEETFADLQSNALHYQRLSYEDSAPSIPGYTPESRTTELWLAGLNQLSIDTDNTRDTIYSQLNASTTASTGRSCMYATGGVTADGPTGSVNYGPFVCGDNTVTETAFVESDNATLNLSAHIEPSSWSDHVLVLQWVTPDEISTAINSEVLTVTDNAFDQYRHSYSLTDTGGTEPLAYVNKTIESGQLHSVIVTDIAYLEKWEPTVKAQSIYLRITYGDVVSTIYRFDVETAELTKATTDEVNGVVLDYQTNSLQQRSNHAVAMLDDTKHQLTKVQQVGRLDSYTEDTTTHELRVLYVIADDTDVITDETNPTLGWRVNAGTYEFVIDTTTQSIVRWSYLNHFGLTEQHSIEANTTLSDDPATFFTEAHWRELLAERGVK